MAILLTPTFSNLSTEIETLYENSFPLHEKRSSQQQEILIAQNKLHVLGIASSGAFAGFITYWKLHDCIFIEHFAVTPATRGKGIGADAMNQMADKFDKIILESEPASASDEARRRLGFYERLGYQLYPFAYEQPPYHKGLLPQKMELLYRVRPPQQAPEFEMIRDEIYRTVYNVML